MLEGCGISCFHLGLHSDKRLFVTSEFPGLNPHIFTIYRFVVAIYFAGFTVWYIPYSVVNYGWTFFIYLTNWTFIVVTCYLLLASYNSLVYYLNSTRREEDRLLVEPSSSADTSDLPFIYKLQWFLYYLAANVSIIVTVVYWTALYSTGNLNFVDLFIDLNVHTLTSFVGIIETMISATPFRFIHVAYPLWYGTVYLFFTIIYWVAGGTDAYGNTYIYPIIDYENDLAIAVISIVGCVIGVFVCQFPGLNPYIFNIYRFVVTVYFIVIFVWYTISSAEEYGWTYCIYLTNWTLILVIVYLLVASFNSALFLTRRSRHNEENALPFVYKLQWVLYNMAATGSVLVTLIYWGAVYSPGLVSLFTDLNVHAFTSLAMIIETLLSATPVRLLHVVYPIAYAISYLVLTLIFWAADGKDIDGNSYIYSIIDYETEPGFSTITVFGALIGVILCHVFIWLLVKLRLKIAEKWFTAGTPDVEAEDRMVGTSVV